MSGEELRLACESASSNLKMRSCPEARPDFADFCVHSAEVGAPIRAVCLAKLESCIVDACKWDRD